MALFFAAAAALAMVLWRPGRRQGIRARHCFRSCRVRPWSCADGVAVEPHGQCAHGQRPNAAACGSVRRLRLEPLGRAPLRKSGGDLRTSRVRPCGRPAARLVSPVRLCSLLLSATPGGAGDWRKRMSPARTSPCASCRPMWTKAKKWRPENSAEIFTEYLDLTKGGEAAPADAETPGLKGIDLVIWPETAVPFLLGDSSRGAARHRRRSSRGNLAARGLRAPRGAERRARPPPAATRLQQSACDRRQGTAARPLRQNPPRPLRRVSPLPRPPRAPRGHATHRRARRVHGGDGSAPGRDPRRSSREPADLLRDHLS